MQNRRTITPKTLTLLFVVFIFGPIGCGLLLSYFTRKMPEPELEAAVRLETMWVNPKGKDESPRLVPCVTVKNLTESPWRNLSIGLDGQFYSSEPKGIPASESFSIPLEAFLARNGSVRFPGGDRKIKLVTVFAQIPSGARAVSEFTIPTRAPTITPEADGERDAFGPWITRNKRN